MESPSEESFIKSQATAVSLESIRICPRGITSNGMFLFVITGCNKIYIYSLKRNIAGTGAIADYMYSLSRLALCYVNSRIAPKEFIGKNGEDDIKFILEVLEKALAARMGDMEERELIKRSLRRNCLNIAAIEDTHEQDNDIIRSVISLPTALPVNLTWVKRQEFLSTLRMRKYQNSFH